MGTRSTTIVLDGNQELCRIYRQMDGYPTGHGLDLAKLCNVQIVNGFGSGMKAGTHANGMGCLAAQIIKGLKNDIGGIYLEPTGGEVSDWCEYIYIVRGKEGEVPTIECTTQTGPFPFNVQEKDAIVFPATAANKITDKFLKKAEKKAA